MRVLSHYLYLIEHIRDIWDLPRQLLFYMDRDDENEFIDYLRSTSVVILPANSPTAEFAPVDTFPEASQELPTRRFWLYNTEIRLPLVTDFEKEWGHYIVNGFQSPVIELLRSLMVSQILLPGRIQADMAYFDDTKQDLVSKPLEYKEWVESIETWIRQKYKHLTLLTYAGPGAERFRNEGGILH